MIEGKHLMKRDICKDTIILSTKSTDASVMDIGVAIDLLDTLESHQDNCVGMAANMIGVNKRIIAFWDENKEEYKIMLNPSITEKSVSYEAEEGCLSLPGVRKTTRYENITVEYQDMSFSKKKEKYSGFTAQIIQHEVDMTNGILI